MINCQFFYKEPVVEPMILININPFNTEAHFLSRVLLVTILLTLGRVYRDQEINDHSLYYFNSHKGFWSCIKSTNHKQNKYENAPQYWRGLGTVEVMPVTRLPTATIIHLFLATSGMNGVRAYNEPRCTNRKVMLAVRVILICAIVTRWHHDKQQGKKNELVSLILYH